VAPVIRLFLRPSEAVGYVIMSARLRLVDMIYGPEPPTPADRQREIEKERLQRAFASIDIDRKRSNRCYGTRNDSVEL
jgi:hypothetical protein